MSRKGVGQFELLMITTKIPALIVAHNPSQGFEHHLDSLYKHFAQIILVDNSSKSETRTVIEKQMRLRKSKLKAILNPQNLGVATALNQGFHLAIQLGYKYLITLDQDSIPASNMILALMDAYRNHPNQAKLAIIAPDIVEKKSGRPTRFIRAKGRFFFERISCQDTILRNLSFVITSGSMYNLELYSQIGAFRDDFFIDSVDSEYCLRAISKGYEISVAGNAHLEHHLGNRQRKQFLGKTYSPTFHSPFRWYYIHRNHIAMIRMYGWRFPYWILYVITTVLSSFFRMMLFEDQRLEKVKCLLYGIQDGLRGRMGEIPLAVRNSLAATQQD